MKCNNPNTSTHDFTMSVMIYPIKYILTIKWKKNAELADIITSGKCPDYMKFNSHLTSIQ